MVSRVRCPGFIFTLNCVEAEALALSQFGTIADLLVKALGHCRSSISVRDLSPSAVFILHLLDIDDRSGVCGVNVADADELGN